MRHPDERPDGERWTGMGHPDEGTIHAWLDGALGPDEAAALERHVAGCATCAAAVAEARGLIAASSQILARLDEAPGGVLPAAPAAPATPAAPAPTMGGAGEGEEEARAGAEADGVVPLASRRRAAVPFWRRGPVRALAAVALVAVGATAVLRETGTDRSLSDVSIAAEEAAPAMEREAVQAAPAAQGAVADTMAALSGAGADAGRSTRADAADTAGTVAAEPTPEAARRAAPRPPAAKAPPPREMAEKTADRAMQQAPERAGERAEQRALPATPAPVVAGAPAGTLSTRSRADSQRRAARVAADAATDAAAGTLILSPVPTGVTVASAPPPPPPAGSTGTVRAFSQRADSQRAGAQRADSAVLMERVFSRAAGVDSAGVASPADSVRRRAAPRGAVAAAPPMVASAPAAPVPVAVERFTGCYRLSVRGAAGEVRDRIEGALPGWLLLDRAARPTADWHVAASAADEEDDTPGRWRVDGAVVLVEWPVDGQVIDLRLRPWAEGLAGTAALLAKGERGEEVSVLARRVACGEE